MNVKTTWNKWEIIWLNILSFRLHNNMFAKILRAPMRFFETSPVGRVLNRFSKDLGTVDEMLPGIILDVMAVS